MTRDERQKECLTKWIKNKCIGSLECCTGFGKTRMGLTSIKAILTMHPSWKVLVVVPTEPLKDQWKKQVTDFGFIDNVDIEIINTVVKNKYDIDLLILDEEHRYASNLFSEVFKRVKYKAILGLTGTFERLDGKHKIVNKYCPIVDRVTIIEALANNWVSDFVEYEVLLDVDNIDEYRQINKQFIGHFEFFGFDFKLLMSLIGKNGFEKRKAYATMMCKDKSRWSEYFKATTMHAMGCMRTMNAKKQFINNHSKKIEIARKIIAARPHSKIITFSNNVKMAESIGMDGGIYTGKMTKKKGRVTLEEFYEKKEGVLHSCTRLNEGADCPGLNVAIILGIDSSSTKSRQRLGRVVRFEEGKKAEIFNIVINDTQEVSWFLNSHKNTPYITIDETNLDRILNGESFTTYSRPVEKFNYQF